MSLIFKPTYTRMVIVPLLMSLWCCISFAQAGAKKYVGTRRQTAVHLDPGVDTAMVKTPTALFAEPSIDAVRVSILRHGDLTVLVSKDIWNGWFRVIQFDSGRQGWVRVNRMFPPIYTHHRAAGVILNGVSLGIGDPPIIEVHNESGTNLYLHLDKLAEIHVSPFTTKSVTVQAGIFAFNASGPKVLPDFGSMAFLPGTKYPWRFFIGSTYGLKKRDKVAPALIAEYNSLLRDVSTGEAATKIERSQSDVDKAALDQAGVKARAESDNLDATRPLLDHTSDRAISDFNRLVGSANDDANTYRKMLAQFNAEADAFNDHLATLNAKKHRLMEIEEVVNASR